MATHNYIQADNTLSAYVHQSDALMWSTYWWREAVPPHAHMGIKAGGRVNKITITH